MTAALDFPSYVGATVVMLLIAGLGTYVPARPAMRVVRCRVFVQSSHTRTGTQEVNRKGW